MKFDKFMNFCFKGLCLLLSCFILAGFCVSCFHSPVNAHAVGEFEFFGYINDMREESEEHLIEVGQAINQDIQNGNLDATTEVGKKMLSAYAMQLLWLNNPAMGELFHAVDLGLQGVDIGYFDDNSTISISGSGCTGLYKSSYDNLYHSFTTYNYDMPAATRDSIIFNVASSDEFSYVCTFTFSSPANAWLTTTTSSQYEGTYIYYTVYDSNARNNVSWSLVDENNKYSSSSGTGLDYYNNVGTLIISRNESSISYPYRPNNFFFSASPFFSIGFSPQSVNIPSDSVSTQSPWDYYNNDILPILIQNNIPDRYIIFPFGYTPSVPDPTEPVTFPNGGIYIDKQFNIGVNIITPTDGNGQPVTDASGETVTETVYVTETFPPDGDYRFQLPTLDTLTMYQATVPNPDISSFTGGFAFIWNCVDHFFTDTGFMPVILACLSLSVLAYVLWKVGG